jgi:periplasmic protein CpxP/Spy
MNKHIAILTVAATLVLGSLLGSGSHALAQTTNRTAIPPAVVSTRDRHGAITPLESMRQSLNLTDEQAKKLEPALKEQQDKLNALRRDTSLSRKDKAAKIKELQQGTDAKIRAQLTPEQAAKWQKRNLNASAQQMSQRQAPGSAKAQALSTSAPAGNDAQTLPNWRRPPTRTQPSQPATQPAPQPTNSASPK